MRKGSGVLPIPLKAVLILALIVAGLLTLTWRLSMLLTNPCWEDAMDKLKPIQESVSRGLTTTLVLDKACVRKVVFTPSHEACEDTCEEYMRHDAENDQRRECLKKCNIQPSMTKTFVIALPTERSGWTGPVRKVADFISTGQFKWLFDGKPVVLSFDCQLEEMEIPGKECNPTGESWVCKPPSEGSRKIDITVEKLTQNTCRIVPLL